MVDLGLVRVGRITNPPLDDGRPRRGWWAEVGWWLYVFYSGDGLLWARWAWRLFYPVDFTEDPKTGLMVPSPGRNGINDRARGVMFARLPSRYRWLPLRRGQRHLHVGRWVAFRLEGHRSCRRCAAVEEERCP